MRTLRSARQAVWHQSSGGQLPGPCLLTPATTSVFAPLLSRLPLAPAALSRQAMSAAAATQLRRHTRSAARLLAAAAEPAEAATEQPRKRQRKSAAQAPLECRPVATGLPEDAAAAVPAPKRAAGGRGGKGKAGSAGGGGPSRDMERELWQQGYARVAGVDEAGRGPLAGPVVAAACIVPEHVSIDGIDDSKKLSEAQREAIYEQLTSHPDVLWAAKVIDAGEIDTINILQAALKAMEGAAAGLPQPPDFLLVDGNRLPKGFDPEHSRPVVKGDSKCLCIAAASVIAKVTRDRLMLELHEQWPQYNFAGHKGYCVPEHVEAIRRHGPCPVHRRTFAPIKTWYPLEPAAAEEEQGEKKRAPAKKGGGRKRIA